ncbi:MAG: S8 family serine peptidase [Bacillota bacterium]|nr:S8 family serine peptidase [Bacillota bacterium]
MNLVRNCRLLPSYAQHKAGLPAKFSKAARLLSIFLAFIISLSSISAYALELAIPPKEKDAAAFKSNKGSLVSTKNTDRLIVKYKDQKKSSKSKSELSNKLKNISFKHFNKLSGIDIIQIPEEKEFNYAVSELEGDNNVEYIQPDYKLYESSLPQDPDFSKEWGLKNSGQEINGSIGLPNIDINVADLWDSLNVKSEVLVGILDTGIDIKHKDLAKSIYVNATETINGYDDDKDGYIDDINGWDFINSDNSVYDSSEEDDHGTHIAGVIAANADSVGIRGVTSGIKIVPLKFMNSGYGFTSDAIEAIEYAKKIGVKIINCSWCDTHYNYALEQEMKNSGILFVCSAGNDHKDLSLTPTFPACFNLPNIISVGAIDNQGSLAPFSNYGSLVDVAAPGVDIYSSIPENNYDYFDGTSMASPFVSGAAALLLSCFPNLSSADLAQIIQSTVKKLPNLKDTFASGGIIDVSSAVSYARLYTPQSSATNSAAVTTTPAATPSPTAISGTWSSKTKMNTARVNFSAVTINNKIYAVGCNKSIEAYDPDTNKWNDVFTAPAELAVSLKDSVTVALNNKIYIMGANNTNKVFEFDPLFNKWSEKASMSFNRGAAAAAVYNGKIYIAGGADEKSAKTVEVYDPDKDSWTTIAGMKTQRSLHSLVVNGSQMYALGGVYSPKSIEQYDFIKEKWTELKDSPINIYSLCAVSIGAKIYIIGNAKENQGNFYEYSPLDSSCVMKEKMPTDRNGLSAAVLNGKIYAIGGNDADNLQSVVEEYTFAPVSAPTSSATVTITPTPTLLSTPAPTIQSQKGRTISGKILAPNISLKNDLTIDVFAELDSGKSYNTTVTLKKASSQDYSILIPDQYINNNFRIGYYISSEENELPKTAYYSPDGSVFDPELAGEINVKSNNASGIDLNLLTKKIISGKIILPNGNTAPKGGIEVNLRLNLQEEAYKNPIYKPSCLYEKTFVIPENQSFIQYNFTVIENNRKNRYILDFKSNAQGYYDKTCYFSYSGTTTNKKSSSLIDVSYNNLYNLNIALQPVKCISGAISLPNGNKAPEGGISVFVSAEDTQTDQDNTSNINCFIIPQGCSSVNYYINIADNDSSKYTVNYFTNEKGYVQTGYFCSGNTTPYAHDASYVNLSNGNITDINLTLIEGYKLCGNISLPSGVAEANDISLSLIIINLDDTKNSQDAISKYIEYMLKISKKTQKTDFEFYLPKGNYVICYENPNFQQNGYLEAGVYSNSGTKSDFNLASIIMVNSLLTDSINLTLLPCNNTTTNSSQGSQTVQGIQIQLPSKPAATVTPAPNSAQNPPSKDTTKDNPKDKPSALNFQDISNHWAKDNILTLISRGIINGYPDNTIRPDKEISRAEIAKLIATMLNLEATAAPDLKFTDKSEIPSWASGYIDALIKKGIIQGYSDNTFRASKYVTRLEMAIIIMRALGYTDIKPSSVTGFKDAKTIPSWASGYVEQGNNLMLFKGYSDSTFRPDKNITRAEAFTIIAKALEHK